MKNISLQQASLFPFIVHCDFSLIENMDFETLCKKQANGIIRIDKQLNNNLLIYASAIKPGQRFTDEQSIISMT